MQDIDKTLGGSIDVLGISLTIELVHKIMRGALAHLVTMCAWCVSVAMVFVTRAKCVPEGTG